MKHYGKLTAAAAAGFMTLSAMGVAPVFAETDTANVTVIVKFLLTLIPVHPVLAKVLFMGQIQLLQVLMED